MQHLHTVPDRKHPPAVALNPEAVPLESDENALGTLQVDLSEQLHFTEGWLVLTDHQLLARQPPATAAEDGGHTS